MGEENKTHLEDDLLPALSREQLIERVLVARNVYRKMQKEIKNLNITIEAYAKDNGILRTKIERLEEVGAGNEISNRDSETSNRTEDTQESPPRGNSSGEEE